VVSVGGTSLITDANFDYLAEFAWESGGGGISVVEAPPVWQDTVVPSALVTSTAGASGYIGGRGVPDIAMFAGTDIPEVLAPWGAELYVAGSAGNGGTVYIGTSLSSPLAVGTWARYETACDGSSLGFAAADYYALASTTPPYTATGFNDTLLGSNAFYTALPGWDYTTGFGSIDISAVYSALVAQGSCKPASTKPLTDSTLAVIGESTTMDTTGNATVTLTASDATDVVSYWVVDFGDGKAGASGTGISTTSPTAPNPDISIQPSVLWPNPTCAASASQGDIPPAGGSSSCTVYPAPTSGDPWVFTHQYATAGTYTVKAFVRNANGVVSPAYSFTVSPGTTSKGITTGGSSGGGSTTGSTTGGTTGGTTTGGSTTGSTTGGTTGGTTTGGSGSSETVTATLTATPTSGTTPLQVAFDASGSSSSNGTAISSYTFYFGDGSASQTTSSPTLSFTYTAAGTFNAQVVATDANGYTAASSTVQITSTATVTVTGSGQAVAAMTVTPTSGSVPLTVQFDGSRSFGANGNAITTYTFDFGDGSQGVSGSSATVSHVYTAAGTYNPTLSVTDSQGNTSAQKAMATVKAIGTGSGGGSGSTATSSGSGGGAFGFATLLPMMLMALRRRRRTR
jgi:PKD repeat protein